MQQVNLAEAATQLPDLFNAAVSGEEIFIIKNSQQAVQLMPVELPQRHPEFGSARGLIVMADDYDAPLEDFKE